MIMLGDQLMLKNWIQRLFYLIKAKGAKDF